MKRNGLYALNLVLDLLVQVLEELDVILGRLPVSSPVCLEERRNRVSAERKTVNCVGVSGVKAMKDYKYQETRWKF